MENIVNNDFSNILVTTHNRTLTLSKCAEMYNLDYDILLAEYINSGDIDNSILNTRIKMQYRDLMLKMIKELNINSLKPTWEPIRKVFNKYKNHYIDLLNYVLEKRRDSVTLTKDDYISLYINSGENKPMVTNENYDKLFTICQRIITGEDIYDEIPYREACELIRCSQNNQFPSELVSEIIRYCLIQEKQKNYPITRYYFDTNLIDCNIDNKTCTRR